MTDPPIPPNNYNVEPSAEVREIAHTMREMFVALINEGFSEKHALTIIGQMMAAGFQAASDSDD